MNNFYNILMWDKLLDNEKFLIDLRKLYKEKDNKRLVNKLKRTKVIMKRSTNDIEEYILKYIWGFNSKTSIIRIKSKSEIETLLKFSNMEFVSPIDLGKLYSSSYLVRDTKTKLYGIYSTSSYMYLVPTSYEIIYPSLLARKDGKWGSVFLNYIPTQYDTLSYINNAKEDIIKADMYVGRKEDRYGMHIFYKDDKLNKQEIKLPVVFDEISLLLPDYNKDIILELTYLDKTGVYSIKENRWLIPPVLDTVISYDPKTLTIKGILNDEEVKINANNYRETDIDKKTNRLIKKL